MKRALTLVAIALLLTGCATKPPPPPPLTQADIISMAKAGLGDEEIIQRIDNSLTVFRLNANDVVTLHNEGVSDRVIDYMLGTYTRAAVAEQRRRDLSYYPYYPYYYNFGFFYGYPWGNRPCW